MKKTVSLLALAAVFAIGAVSCDRGGEPVEKGNATLSIEYGFKDAQVVQESRGATSSAIPTTNWNENIKSLTLILTNSSGNIQKVLSPTPPSGTGVGTQPITTISNLDQGNTYKVYLIANAATATSPHGTVAISPSPALNDGLVGQNINTLTFNTVAHAGPFHAGITAANQQPTEIFWATKDVTLSGTSATAHLELERSVALLRVRINKNFSDATTSAVNADVDFTGAQAAFILRRTSGAGFKAVDGAVTGTGVNFYYQEPFIATAPASGYTGSMSLGAAGTNDFTLWNDYLILPGGAANVNDGFSIVIIGQAPAGYIPIDIATGGDVATAVPAGTPIFWVAGVDKAITKNNILELNVTLKSKGFTGTIPVPGTYGEVVVSAELEEWGNITVANINI